MSSGAHRPPPKKEVFLALLEGPSVFVHLDPRKTEVAVPAWFKKEPRLVLQLGMNMAVPIPDLKIDEEGISCTLSFSRNPFACKLPWSAIFAMVGEDQRGMVWPSDIPPELAAQMTPAQAAPKPAPPPPAPEPALEAKAEKPKKKRAPKKKAHANGEATDGASKEAAAPKPKRTPAPRTSGPRPEPRPAAAPAPAPALAREEMPPPPQPAAASSSIGSGKKPRRELPSYLRVIK
jgi:hypothetical protein